MEESYIEGRFGVVMEEIRDALLDISSQLQQINEKLGSFEECVETRTQLRMIRVVDMTRPPQ